MWLSVMFMVTSYYFVLAVLKKQRYEQFSMTHGHNQRVQTTSLLSLKAFEIVVITVL